MDLLKKNLKSLAKHDADLVHSITEYFTTNTNPKETIRWKKNLSQELIPYIQWNSGKEIRLGSAYSVDKQIDFWMDNFISDIKFDSLLFIFGIGNGMVLDKVLSYVPEECTVVVYEPSAELFMQMIERLDLSEILSNKRLYIFLEGINTDELFNSLEIIGQRRMIDAESIVVMSMPSYREIYTDKAEEMEELLDDWYFFRKQNRVTIQYWLEKTVEEPLKKMYYYKKAIVIEHFYGKWDVDMPVVIVSAGPSLKKNGKELHKLKGKVLIVAVDMALPALKMLGIVPDIIISIDSGVKAQYVCLEEYRNVPLLCTVGTAEELYLWNDGKKILFREQPFLQKIKEKAGLPVAGYGYFGSVSLAAFAIFSMLGTKNIVLVGQDLAYGEDGKSHAGNYDEGKIENPIQLPGYYGGEVDTRVDWLGFWNWYKRRIPEMKEITVINATEGGAAIPGSIQRSLREIAEEYQDKVVPDDLWDGEEYYVTEDEYHKMNCMIEECRNEVTQLLAWDEIDYTNKKNELENLDIYPLLYDVIYAMEGESKWECFQMAVKYLSEHGWRKEDDEQTMG